MYGTCDLFLVKLSVAMPCLLVSVQHETPVLCGKGPHAWLKITASQEEEMDLDPTTFQQRCVQCSEDSSSCHNVLISSLH